MESRYKARIEGNEEVDHYEIKLLSKSGREVWVDFTSGVINFDGAIAILGTAFDITEHKNTKDQIENSLSLLQTTLESSIDGILAVDTSGKIINYNQKFTEMWDISRVDQDKIKHINDLTKFEKLLQEPTSFTANLKEYLGEKPGETFEVLELTNGKIYEQQSKPQIKGGKVVGRVWSFHDITEHKKAVDQLVHDAFHDKLTNLPNKALLIDRLGKMIQHKRRKIDYNFAAIILNLDRFTIINDSLGHEMGDYLIKLIAQRLQTCLRPGDTVARLSADEFGIILNDIKDERDPTRIANRIKQELSVPFNLGGNEIFTTACMGIAIISPGYTRAEDLLRDADIALHRAKGIGKGCHETFDQDMHVRTVALLQLENDLRKAIEKNEFHLNYQPLINLETGEISGFEALIRWIHSERGFISPVEFIPVAEETSLIIPIGKWVLEEACRQMSVWFESFPEKQNLTINVNLSSIQFSHPNIIEDIQDVLRTTNLPSKRLKLEITESVIMENAELAITKLLTLKDMDIKLNIDDFGTGYSSLSYLHKFPFDTLKIDRSFVMNMGEEDENYEIVRTIVNLANNLGMEVTAEGVETADQLQILRALRCNYGQGYLFSKPVDAKTATELLVKNPRW